ncbi:MAG: GIN domain-containing protein [Phenylobacterium sp.]|uniref:GIN domain-containing protein n=1 Tax=Phenylobacterium sp. TaxID=1871053 RepID=UPI003919A66A
MRLLTFAAAAGLSLVATAANAASVEIRDAVARVVVVPEARDDVRVEIISRNASLPIEVRTMGERTIVDGDLDRKIRSCNGSGERASANVAGVGRVDWADMPQVVIRTPMNAVVEAGGAVFGSVGRSASLKLSNAGCGDWKVANVAGKLTYSQAGSGDARIGAAGEAVLRVAGSGDVNLGEVSGPLDVRIAGSGDVRIGAGRAETMAASVAGSGDVEFKGQAGSLKARIAGSGDVRVKSVTGEVTKAVLGSGAVTIG